MAGEPPGVRVEAVGLSRRFAERVALHEIDLSVEAGEAFALLGVNGAGKTTFIRILAGLLTPSRGDLRVDGLSSATHPREVQHRLGFVSEVSHLYPELGVERFLAIAAGLRGLAGKAARDAVEQALERFDLGEVRKRRIGNLSKGFAQRVSLAQALLHAPRLVVADEPTSGLDPSQRSEVQRALGRETGRRTLILCTHDLDEARRLTQRCAVLSRGCLVAAGPTDEILDADAERALFRGGPAQAPGEAGSSR